MEKNCTVDGCESPYFGRGYCNRHYWQLIRKPKIEERMAQCAWCGERKPISAMRHPESSRGKTPSTCHACRESHPGQAWCDFHREPHARDKFAARPDRPIGVENSCIWSQSIRASRSRGHAPITCVSCGSESESWNYRGGRAKCPTCRDCEETHPGQHWCIDCAAWLPRERFVATGKDGKYLTVRCRPCRTANLHGVTVRQVLAIQGCDYPACAACGSTDFLKIDHDHGHCPASRGCPECVRGFLCHACNTSEGLLRSPERARQLAAYMERVAR